MLCVASSIYHNVDFSFPSLDDEGASQSQAFVWVVTLKGGPQGRHQTAASRSLLGPHLQDLQRRTGHKLSQDSHSPFVNVYPSKCWGLTNAAGLKFTQSGFSNFINSQIIVFKFMCNQTCLLKAKEKMTQCIFSNSLEILTLPFQTCLHTRTDCPAAQNSSHNMCHCTFLAGTGHRLD